MVGPGSLLLLGGLLGGIPQIWGGPGGSETAPNLEEEVSIVRRSDPALPHCFSRTLHDLSCFWDTPGPPEPRRFRLQFRLEQDPWQECPLSATALSPGGGSRFWCSLPAAATVTFVPLELRVLPATPPGATEATKATPEATKATPEATKVTPGATKATKDIETTPTTSEVTEATKATPEATKATPEATKDIGTPPGATKAPPGATSVPKATKVTEPPPAVSPLFQRTLYIDQVVLSGPPQNVSVSAGGARGELCVRWAPPPGPYLHSSLVFELALSPPGGPPKTVGVPAGRREQGVGGLRASTPYQVRARARPDGLSYGGFWSPWSPPATATTPPDLDAVTLGLSCLLVLLLLGLGALGLLGHRRTLRAKLWPPVPGPEREFEGLFSAYGGNFQLWLYESPGSPWAPPWAPPADEDDEDEDEEQPSALEELGEGPGAPPPPEPPPPGSGTPPAPLPLPPGGGGPTPSPSPSFEYTVFDPGSALLCPSPAPYANLRPLPKGGDPKPGGHAPNYVICS